MRAIAAPSRADYPDVMTTCDQAAFENLVGCRDLLAFTLTGESQPPADLIEPLSNMVDLLFRRVEELRVEHGFADPDCSIHDPRIVARFDGSVYGFPPAGK